MRSFKIALAADLQTKLQKALDRKRELIAHMKENRGRLTSAQMEKIFEELDAIQMQFADFGESVYRTALVWTKSSRPLTSAAVLR